MDPILRDHLTVLGYEFKVEVTTAPVYWSLKYKGSLLGAAGHNSDVKVTPDRCWEMLFRLALDHADFHKVRL